MKNVADMGEKLSAKIWRNFSPRNSSSTISRESRREKFHEKSSTNSTSHETEFFHCEALKAWGHKGFRIQGTQQRSPSSRAFCCSRKNPQSSRPSMAQFARIDIASFPRIVSIRDPELNPFLRIALRGANNCESQV